MLHLPAPPPAAPQAAPVGCSHVLLPSHGCSLRRPPWAAPCMSCTEAAHTGRPHRLPSASPS
eukprot:2002784-Pyramimonas_sp.AAC.1